MKLTRLHWLLIVSATAVLVVMAPSDNEGDTRTSKRASDTTSRYSGAGRDNGQGVDLDKLARLEVRGEERGKVGNVFDPTSWYVPPPPVKYVPAQQVAPSVTVQMAPSAPPIPFTYLGRYGDTESRIIILSKGDKVYTVSIGDVIESTYRVERFGPGVIVLKYLPLNIEQTLRTGEPS
jgi:hypothetical protein